MTRRGAQTPGVVGPYTTEGAAPRLSPAAAPQAGVRVFTGIIQHVGRVARADGALRRVGATDAYRLEVDVGPLASGLLPGASVAVNGACLTVAEVRGAVARFDVVPETWRRTTLGGLRTGEPVNLERSLRVGDSLDGHFVQGHVDGVGTVRRIDRGGGEWRLYVRCDAGLLDLVVPKGSITLDGTSLTVVDVTRDGFSVALVPTTLERTVLGRRQPGDCLNIETDILARLVLRRATAYADAAARSARGVSWDLLESGGYGS